MAEISRLPGPVADLWEWQLKGACREADPTLFPVVGPYLSMRALPSSLDPARPRATEIYASGWRPRVPDGPTRDELADLVTRSAEATGATPTS